MYKRQSRLILPCLAALVLLASAAGAQGTAVLNNAQVNFGNNLQATFATASAPVGSGGGSPPIYRGPGAAIPMPDLPRSGNVTLSQGSFVNTPTFWQWYNSITMNTVARTTVVVSGSVAGNPVNWVFNNAWPTEVAGVSQSSDGNTVQVERLEIAYENVVVQQQ